MTHDSSDEAIVATVVGLASVAGALLGLSSLFGTRWWVNLIIVIVAAVATLAAFESDPEAGIGLLGPLALFALYGYVTSLGWTATIAIVIVCTMIAFFLASDGHASQPPAPRPPPRRASAEYPKSPPSHERRVSDETLERYARQYLDEGGARDTRAVLNAVRRRVSDERLVLGPRQDLSWIASRALASSRSPAPSPAPRQEAVQATGKPRRNARENLHEFGSFEIERVIIRILEDRPSATDGDLIDGVLASLDVTDRSPFALDRLSDAIARVRQAPPRSTEERRTEQRERLTARVPTRDSGGRTKLYEYGSHEIERVVEELLAVEPKLTDERLHEEVVRVLGIEDASNLAKERIAHAAAKVSSSPHKPGTGARAALSAPKKKAATKKATKKATPKKTTTKKATKKATPKKAAAKKSTKKAAKRPSTPKKTTKKTTSPNGTAGPAVEQEASKASTRGRQAGRETPSSRSEPPSREGGTGAPGAKDIADLLGF